MANVDGSYKYDSKKSSLEWQVAVIDASNKEGSLEFTVNGNRADDFFPVEVSFTSQRTYAGIEVCPAALLLR